MKRSLFYLILLQSFILFAQDDNPFMLSTELLYNYAPETQIISTLSSEYNSLYETLDSPDLLKDSQYYFLNGMVQSRLENKDLALDWFQKSYDSAKESLNLNPSIEAYQMLASAGFGLSSTKGISGIISMADELDLYSAKILEFDSEDALGLLISSQKLIYAPKLFGGDPQEALTFLNRVEPQLEDLPKAIRFDVLYALSNCWERLKDKEKAFYYVDEALKLYPGNEEALQWREEI